MRRIADQGTSAVWLETKQTPQWDEFVRQHPHGLVYHHSAWKEVLEESFPHIKGRFLVLRDKESRIVAGLPVYTVKSWLLGNRAVSVPFASICDPLIGRTEDLTALRSCLSAMLRETVSKALQIRSMRTTKLIAETDLTATVGYKHHYLPLDKTRDELFMEFSESCIRKKIRKAKRNGIVVEVRQSDADLRAFYDILTETRRRVSIPPIPFRFFQSIWKHLGLGNRTLFIALRDGRPIGCLLVLQFRDIWTAEYIGDTASARGSGVNQFLYWEAIQLAHSRGGKIFSFGRTAKANDGLLEYKRRWATVEEDLTDFTFSPSGDPAHSLKRPRSRELSVAYRLARSIIGCVPGPVYQMIGSFCYRHLG